MSRIAACAAALLIGLALGPGEAVANEWSRGVAAFKAGRLTQAEAEFQSVVRKEPDWPGGHFMLGQVQMKQGKHRQALEHLQRAYDLKPADVSYQYALGQAYLQNGLYSEATEVFEEMDAASLPPTQQLNYHKQLAAALTRTGDPGDAAEAIGVLKRITELDPGDAAAWFSYGTTAFNSGDTEAGLAAMRRAIELDSGNVEWRETHSLALSSLEEEREAQRLAQELRDSPEADIDLGDSADSCLKMVFGRYCLGADAGDLPEPAIRSEDFLTYKDDGEVTAVTVVGGRIGGVLRLHRPGSWLSYRRLLGTLESKYGPGEDQSYFPDHADDDDSRSTSIHLGRAEAKRLWRQSGWTIVLSWSGSGEDLDTSVNLLYYHNVLWKVRRAEHLEQY